MPQTVAHHDKSPKNKRNPKPSPIGNNFGFLSFGSPPSAFVEFSVFPLSIPPSVGTHNIPQKMAEIQRNRICYQRSNISPFLIFIDNFGYGKINVTILTIFVFLMIFHLCLKIGLTAYTSGKPFRICLYFTSTAKLHR